jgi:FMN reductase
VAELVAAVSAAELVVVASPTYKGTYSGLLKLFLDRFVADALRGVARPTGARSASRPASSPR